MKTEQVDAYYMKGRSHDCGSKLGYMTANVEYALRHPELGDEFWVVRRWRQVFQLYYHGNSCYNRCFVSVLASHGTCGASVDFLRST